MTWTINNCNGQYTEILWIGTEGYYIEYEFNVIEKESIYYSGKKKDIYYKEFNYEHSG